MHQYINTSMINTLEGLVFKNKINSNADHLIYLALRVYLKASFVTSSRAFWMGYPVSISMKQIPTRKCLMAYAK